MSYENSVQRVYHCSGKQASYEQLGLQKPSETERGCQGNLFLEIVQAVSFEIELKLTLVRHCTKIVSELYYHIKETKRASELPILGSFRKLFVASFSPLVVFRFLIRPRGSEKSRAETLQ